MVHEWALEFWNPRSFSTPAKLPAVVSKRGVDGNLKVGLSPAGAGKLLKLYHICQSSRILFDKEAGLSPAQLTLPAFLANL